MCAEKESEREAEARFAVLTFLIKRSVECPVSQRVEGRVHLSRHFGGDDRAGRGSKSLESSSSRRSRSFSHRREGRATLLASTPKAREEEQVLNHVNFAHWSTPQQATFRTEVLWPLPPLSTIDPRSEPEGALPPVETDDSLNAGWDGPPSWNVSAAAMTGDNVL